MFRHLRIATKYPLFIVALAFLASFVTGSVGYLTTFQELRIAEQRSLAAILETRKSSLDGYFRRISEDLRVQADSPLVIEAVQSFQDAWREIDGDPATYLQQHYIEDNPHPTGEKHLLDSAGDSSLYSFIHQRFHPTLRRLLRSRGYYDIFLIDPHGNLIYTVFKELDFATNLVEGPWADTDLGRAFRRVRDNAQPDLQVFFDFRPYAPSYGAPASFIASPIYDTANREFLGVLAFQLPIDRLNAVLQDRAGLGESGETYIVGQDFLRRSNSQFSEGSEILRQKVDSTPVRRALSGGVGVATIDGWRGEPVLSAYDSFDFLGTRWAIIAEVSEDEVLFPATRMRDNMLIVMLLAALFVGGIGLLLARNLSRPVAQITDTMNRLAHGDFEVEVGNSERLDEFGEMEQALQVFKENALARRETETKLAAQSSLLRTVLSNVAQGIALFDSDGRLAIWNQRYVDVLNVPVGRIKKGTTFQEIANFCAQRGDYGTGDPQQLVEQRLRLFRDNERTKSEIVVSGSGIYEVLSQQTADGGFVLAYTDITERRASAELLTSQRDELVMLNQQKNRFFSVLAHDLRAPFNALLGYSELLRRHVDRLSREEIVDYVANISQSSEQAYTLLENLLEWARGQMNEVSLQLSPLWLDEVLAETLQGVKPAAAAKGISLSGEFAPCKVLGDRHTVQIVLRNLIHNAIKFTPEGGSVAVRIVHQDDNVEVAVEDNGVGMSQEALSRLFNWEESRTTVGTGGETGTGLGLILCRDYVEKLGGEISVDSEEGKGTRFTFTLQRL